LRKSCLVKEKDPKAKIIYMPLMDFVRNITTSLRHNTIEDMTLVIITSFDNCGKVVPTPQNTTYNVRSTVTEIDYVEVSITAQNHSNFPIARVEHTMEQI
jgi:hypothetical protein